MTQTKQVRPVAAAYFSKHVHKAHPNGIVASHIFPSWMSISYYSWQVSDHYS